MNLTGIEKEDLAKVSTEMKELMKKAPTVRLHQRYQTIYLLTKGYTVNAIAEIIGITAASIYTFAGFYREGGVEGLNLDKYKGSSSKLTPNQEEELKDVITNKRPVDVGFPIEMNWTSPLVREYIEKEFAIEYSESGVKALLHRLDFSYTRPTYVLAKAEPAKQEKFLEEFEEIKKNFQETQI
jgi:putative transposase